MYQIQIYPITPFVWRWEVRCGGSLLCCGTAATKEAANRQVSELISA